ncbi:type-F conjugative transfer system pilin assembly protein TraF [Klebsiella aerogenes]|uniref:type-F conjugative transfer system pilin assembly protein TraF n=1 Tax=Klebsiella aerogenes TaxID=548 RepID=UPI000DA1D060|nr:type-F conjugative transfer system pilin assembly protein TraF [Klebsiella aerogenes]HCB2859837.1 type-F conjugative transfer system pilin assembly protein TraF [Klebsiella aerogenes]HCB2864840.1 type-F conjugative transfer system pilin assembly protein TraF [Klebsiella aerogenes]HCB2880488.1 type-F conjugative transfer system pilin assembly protein TraF [Klebsiella aerogenes]HCB3345903.1 type-F conjugative transfer system pilin assembly protein TraF [Klebsiella aerogenes]HCM1811905.1 type-
MNRLLYWLAALAVAISGTVAAAPTKPAETPVENRTYTDDPVVGWHWYNEPQPEETPEDDAVPLSALPPSTQMAVLQQLTKEKLDTAILQPSPEHAADFLRLQSVLVSLSGQFTRTASQALLQYPELDHNVKESRYNSTAPLQVAARKAQQNEAISSLGQRYGLFLFYRGNNAVDSAMAGAVQSFAAQYHLSFIPVSMDGARSPTLPQTRPDSGQAARMGITTFPALYLVSPAEGQYQPLAYGFMTHDDLARRFLDVATGFAAPDTLNN